MIDQEKIHNQCLSDNLGEREEALGLLRYNLSSLPDKQQAWNDLIRLTNEENWMVRTMAVSALGSAFPHMPDKQQAWNDLHKLVNDQNCYVREAAASALGFTFPHRLDKQYAWDDLHKLTNDQDRWVRFKAAKVIGTLFSQLPDKRQAWNDLHKLTNDQNSCLRLIAAKVIKALFSQLPDKQQAWNDLIKLTNDQDHNVKSRVASALYSVILRVPDKQQAWNDLIKLTSHEYSDMRNSASYALGIAFPQMQDKQQAWNDLIKLTTDNSSVTSLFASALGSAFPHVPDKQQAWSDLHRLMNDKEKTVRLQAASALGSAFPHAPDKQQAWNDLHKLANDKESSIRYKAAYALGVAFFYMPDKQQAWNDLHKLVNDQNCYVREATASALGFTFPHILDRQYAWDDLHRLANDQNRYVRVYANHSLGKVSIFKASQTEKKEDYKKELEKAIEFFEKAAYESPVGWLNPSQFCLPFYRSFHTVIFKKRDEKKEVDKYLTEAKDAVRGSKSKELLFEAVENLANALKKVENLRNLNFEAMKSEISFYRQYCDRAAELMGDTEKTAPFATIAMRKGLPILDRNLKELLEEIQEKAKIACQASQGTPTQEIACSVRREVQKWEISSQEEMSWYVENLIFTLESTIPRTPKNQNFFDRISEIREEKDIVKQYAIVCTIIPLIPRVSMDEKINNMEKGIDDFKKGVGIVNENTTIIIEKLDEIQEELKKGFESLDKLSIKVGGTEGECLKIFSEKLLEITKKGDSETLNLFLEEVLKNEDTLTREIESSSAPQKEKEESKGNISKLKSLLKKVKNPAKEFGKDVANEIVVSYTAKGIVELFLPIMSMAIFGVPIPSQIVDMLANVVTELKD